MSLTDNLLVGLVLDDGSVVVASQGQQVQTSAGVSTTLDKVAISHDWPKNKTNGLLLTHALMVVATGKVYDDLKAFYSGRAVPSIQTTYTNGTRSDLLIIYEVEMGEAYPRFEWDVADLLRQHDWLGPDDCLRWCNIIRTVLLQEMATADLLGAKSRRQFQCVAIEEGIKVACPAPTYAQSVMMAARMYADINAAQAWAVKAAGISWCAITREGEGASAFTARGALGHIYIGWGSTPRRAAENMVAEVGRREPPYPEG